VPANLNNGEGGEVEVGNRNGTGSGVGNGSESGSGNGNGNGNGNGSSGGESSLGGKSSDAMVGVEFSRNALVVFGLGVSDVQGLAWLKSPGFGLASQGSGLIKYKEWGFARRPMLPSEYCLSGLKVSNRLSKQTFIITLLQLV
jgi:hypothetical protein